MSSRFLTLLLCAGVLLSGCDRVAAVGAKLGFKPPQAAAPAKTAPAPAPNLPRERVEPIRWDEGFGAFWYDNAPLNAARQWRFDNDIQGFSGSAGLVVSPLDGVQIVNRMFDSAVRSPNDLNIDGARHTLVLVRLTRLSDAPPWNGILVWSTAGHGEDQAYQTRAFMGDAPAVGETVILAYDMANPRKGGDDWVRSVIRQIRFDTDDGTGSRFRLRQVAIVENPAPDVLKAPPWPPKSPPLAATAQSAGLR